MFANAPVCLVKSLELSFLVAVGNRNEKDSSAKIMVDFHNGAPLLYCCSSNLGILSQGSVKVFYNPFDLEGGRMEMEKKYVCMYIVCSESNYFLI